jgi:hypothetical protein
VLRADDRSLTGEEADADVKSILETLEKYREKGEREKEFGKKLEGNVFDFGENVEKFVEKYLGQIHSIIKQRSEAEVR